MDYELNETLNAMFDCIENNKNFLLEAGAGAGKTHSLVETIKYINKNYPKRKMLCITYTNNAKEEIINRLNTKDNIFISPLLTLYWFAMELYMFIKPTSSEICLWFKNNLL